SNFELDFDDTNHIASGVKVDEQAHEEKANDKEHTSEVDKVFEQEDCSGHQLHERHSEVWQIKVFPKDISSDFLLFAHNLMMLGGSPKLLTISPSKGKHDGVLEAPERWRKSIFQRADNNHQIGEFMRGAKEGMKIPEDKLLTVTLHEGIFEWASWGLIKAHADFYSSPYDEGTTTWSSYYEDDHTHGLCLVICCRVELMAEYIGEDFFECSAAWCSGGARPLRALCGLVCLTQELIAPRLLKQINAKHRQTRVANNELAR
ncbi:hypothetical protein KI387_026916, partial [Taxus chinensis]